MFLESELIGEFRGKNTGYRVLPDGKVETNAQGMGKILGMDSFLMSTATGMMSGGVFMGEVNSIVMTTTGETIMFRGTAVGYPTDSGGGMTRGASIQMSNAQKLAALNKAVVLTEFVTNIQDNWTGKFWLWK